MSDIVFETFFQELRGDFEELKSDVDAIKTDVCLLKKKKLYIEDIAIGSFMGWCKLTAGIILFIITLLGSGYALIDRIDTLRIDYSSHLHYLHKDSKYTNDNETH